MLIKLNESEIIGMSKFKPGQQGITYCYPWPIDENPDKCYADWLTLRADSSETYAKVYWDLDPAKELFNSLDNAVVFAHKYLAQSNRNSCYIFKILSKTDFLPVYTVYNQNKNHTSL